MFKKTRIASFFANAIILDLYNSDSLMQWNPKEFESDEAISRFLRRCQFPNICQQATERHRIAFCTFPTTLL